MSAPRLREAVQAVVNSEPAHGAAHWGLADHPTITGADCQSMAWARETLRAALEGAAAPAEAEIERLRAWVEKRKTRDRAGRARYRAAHPELHRKSSRESMARMRARARAALEEQP